jgi:alpha-1,2-mannosyltransferase
VIGRPETVPAQPEWLAATAAWLTPRRLRAHAIILAICLWGAFAIDFSTPGFFDRAGNIKFQDFLTFYVSARQIAQGSTNLLYDQHAAAVEMQAIVAQANGPQRIIWRLPNLYGPQVGLFFVPLTRFSFATAARIWVTLCMLLFFACVYAVWKFCPALRPYPGMVAVSAIAFPPLFHFFVRGQNSALVTACFAAAFLAFGAERRWLAGIVLGVLVFKPQFLVAIPLVLLLSGEARALIGLVASAGAQLAFARIYFGSVVMRAYFETLLHFPRWIGTAEPGIAHMQMHSLRSFWALLIPWPEVALTLYILSALVVVWWAAAIWKSSSALALRFSALTLAAVLVDPHLFVYDLLALTPMFLLLADWTAVHPLHPSANATRLLMYLAFVLPLFGPLAQWTHIQLSVLAFTVLLWTLRRQLRTTGHKLASNESAVV